MNEPMEFRNYPFTRTWAVLKGIQRHSSPQLQFTQGIGETSWKQPCQSRNSRQSNAKRCSFQALFFRMYVMW